MEKTLQVIEEMIRLGIIKAYAIGGGIAATYYIEHGLENKLKNMEGGADEK